MNNSTAFIVPGLSEAILQTAAYADVFDYPLTSAEIHRYLTGICAAREDVECALRTGALLTPVEDYYTLPGREMLVSVRRRREQIAARLWPQALRYGRLISRLPFVRMLAVTGSLAMNNVENNPDIDYLIVTAPGRLWMVRALILLVTRLAALQGVRLCPNYLVTEQALVFTDQTLYTAHELAQMIPLFGLDVYARILRLNGWKDRFLPNSEGTPPAAARIAGGKEHPGVRPFLEAILRTQPGAWFERWEMNRKIRRLSREQSSSPESCFDVHVCKGHLHRHGQYTGEILREKLESLALERPV